MSLQNLSISKVVKAYLCYLIIDQNSFNYKSAVFKIIHGPI